MKTIFSRTMTTLTTIILLVFVLVGLSFYLLVDDYMEEQAVERLKTNCTVVTEVAAAAHQENLITGKNFLVNLSIASYVSGTDTVICDENGTLLICSEDLFGCDHRGMVISRSYLNKVLASDFVTSRTTLEGLYDDLRYVVAAPILDAEEQTVGIVISSMSMDSTNTVLRWLLERFLSVSLVIIAVTAVVLTLFAKKNSSPLQEMAETAVAFGHGNLKARVKLQGRVPAEVEDLALAFNNMADSLEKSEYQRQEFVANVSHELKTPMTTISGYVDGILDGTIPVAQQDKYLQIVSDESKRLNRLVRSMLDISRLQEQGGIPEEMCTPFELASCMGQSLFSFEQKINEKKINMDVLLPDHPVYVKACQDHIHQVIYNLMDNAVKFCPQEGTISAKVTLSENKAFVSIANDGPPIPEEELSLLFDRFHKLDKSRSENRDGWGLGLYIVKTIICSHGEDISVSSRDGVTTFTFTLTLSD